MHRREGRRSGRAFALLIVVSLAIGFGSQAAGASDIASRRGLEAARNSQRWVDEQIAAASQDHERWLAVLERHDRDLDALYRRLDRTEWSIRAGELLENGARNPGVATTLARADRLRQKITRIAADPAAATAFRRAVAAQQLAESLTDDVRRTQRLVDLLSSPSLLEPDALTREDWARLLLGWLGAPPCQDNLRVLVAWQVQESTAAAWNPLATTIDAGGVTGVLNAAGVGEFDGLDAGLGATRRTLLLDGYGYDWIRYGLLSCQPIATTARYIRDSAWCRDCGGGEYVGGLLDEVQADYEAFRDTRLGTPSEIVAPVIVPGIPIQTCPVAGEHAFIDGFGDPRPGGRTHEGIDLIAAEGTPIVAAHAGTVFYGWNTLGGNAAYVRAEDGTYTYYAHLSRFGDVFGQTVPAGTVIGFVGHTGDASGPHLHFEYHPGGGPAIDPYTLLLTVC
jgi:Peptidase family M23